MGSKLHHREQLLTHPKLSCQVAEPSGVLLVCTVEIDTAVLPSLYNLNRQDTEL